MEQNFDYNDSQLRVITDENEESWFAAIDICNILDYADPSQAIDKLDEDEKKLDRVKDGSGQLRKTWIVNEPGLYSLILTSTKSEARTFKRWITHHVIPAIRKAGKYTSEEEKERESELISMADEIQKRKEEKDIHQKKVNDLRRDIESKMDEIISHIRKDKSQLRIQFPQ